jgi:hypothetical protein
MQIGGEAALERRRFTAAVDTIRKQAALAPPLSPLKLTLPSLDLSKSLKPLPEPKDGAK